MATQEELILKQFASQRQALGQRQAKAADEMKQGLQRRQAIGGLTGGSAIKAANKAQKNLESEFATQESAIGGQEAEALRRAKSEEEAKQFAREERLGSQDFGAQQAQLGREFQTGERLGSQEYGAQQAQLGRQFQSSEREAAQQFASAEANLGRQFTSQEREAVQAFQEAQRLGAQDFASAEAALGRQFTSEERQAVQAFQAAESKKDRAQQESQFARQYNISVEQLREQKRQFNENLSYMFQEMDINKQTNIINAMIAFKNAGINTGSQANWYAKQAKHLYY